MPLAFQWYTNDDFWSNVIFGMAYGVTYHKNWSHICDHSSKAVKALKDLPEPSEWVESKNDNGDISWEPSHISVPQPSGILVPVPTKYVSDPTLMLGVHCVPRGNGIYHIDAMKNKGDLWADRQITRPLCSSDAWLSFF